MREVTDTGIQSRADSEAEDDRLYWDKLGE